MDRPIAGASMNGILFTILGLACSLINSLIASANGIVIPISVALLGPFRS